MLAFETLRIRGFADAANHLDVIGRSNSAADFQKPFASDGSTAMFIETEFLGLGERSNCSIKSRDFHFIDLLMGIGKSMLCRLRDRMRKTLACVMRWEFPVERSLNSWLVPCETSARTSISAGMRFARRHSSPRSSGVGEKRRAKRTDLIEKSSPHNQERQLRTKRTPVVR
jgi:hypothetical protein